MKHLVIVGFVLAALIVGGLFVGVVRAAPACTGQQGIASWYSYTGRPTASGVPYTGKAMTAAHRSLPFGTVVQVIDLATGRGVMVRIDDRGPWARGRVIDLSKAAAQQLGIIRRGTAMVCLQIIFNQSS